VVVAAERAGGRPPRSDLNDASIGLVARRRPAGGRRSDLSADLIGKRGGERQREEEGGAAAGDTTRMLGGSDLARL
jgi:hypothetical protein